MEWIQAYVPDAVWFDYETVSFLFTSSLLPSFLERHEKGVDYLQELYIKHTGEENHCCTTSFRFRGIEIREEICRKKDRGDTETLERESPCLID